MTPQEIVDTVRNLPPENRREILKVLQSEAGELKGAPGEQEVQRILFERGIIGNIPSADDYTDADDNFEPIEIKGKPLSETVIEERR